jgi:hypothetical protein
MQIQRLCLDWASRGRASRHGFPGTAWEPVTRVTRYQAEPGNADLEALPRLGFARQSLQAWVPRHSLGTS